MESAADSLNLVTTPVLCKALKDAGVSGLSGAKTAELMRLAQEHLSPIQLKDAVPVRFYKLTTAGRAPLDAHPEVVVRHPKKG
jgi:hypothetical protein